MRFHGESYPLAPNTNAANRARNRRVNIQLERVAVPDKTAPQAKAPSNPAATS